MTKIAVEVDIKQLGRIINELPLPDKIELTRDLERQTLGKMIEEIFKKVDRRRKKFPISEREIKQEVESVRRQIYGKGSS